MHEVNREREREHVRDEGQALYGEGVHSFPAINFSSLKQNQKASYGMVSML